MARGEYVGLLDHDDLLAPDALYETACRISGGADVIYTDEDKVTEDAGEHYQPHLKPDFNLDLLRSNNYICHFLVVRRSLIASAGDSGRSMTGHRIMILCSGVRSRRKKSNTCPGFSITGGPTELPQRIIPPASCMPTRRENGPLREILPGPGRRGRVSQTEDFGFYHVEYPVQGEPLVSILIPNRDQRETLKNCIRSIREKSTYRNYEILIIENNSREAETFSYYRQLEQEERIRILKWEHPFNIQRSTITRPGRQGASICCC